MYYVCKVEVDIGPGSIENNSNKSVEICPLYWECTDVTALIFTPFMFSFWQKQCSLSQMKHTQFQLMSFNA